MEKILAAILKFVFCDYLWILGIVVLVRGIYHIVKKAAENARLHPVAAWMLVGAVLIHTVLYLCLDQTPSALILAAQCFVPAFAAQMAGRFTHKKKPGAVLEAIVITVTYGIICLLAVLFTDWIIGIYLVALFMFWVMGDIFFPARRRCPRADCSQKNCDGCEAAENNNCQGCCCSCSKCQNHSADQ